MNSKEIGQQSSDWKISIATLEDAKGIHEALIQNLIEIRDFDKISKKQRKSLENQGFLRKEVGIDYYEQLIGDPNVDIYVAKYNSAIIGFASIHKKKYDIVKVRDVIGELTCDDERTRKLLLDDNIEFGYLDQVSILAEYKRKGLGTVIFQRALLGLNTPVVAFIVEEPLLNKASIYWHEYNGFKLKATSGGEYKGKSFKFQIFIHWNEKE
jgi:hypothetical protein